MVDMKRVQALVPSGTGLTARIWPFDRSDPVLIMGLLLLPKVRVRAAAASPPAIPEPGK